MKAFVLGAGTSALALERALGGGPLELALEEAPLGVPRLDLVLALARAAGPLVALFDRDLGTPLAECALVSPFARFPDGAHLDLSGALLSPLLLRHGACAAARLIAAHGVRLPAAEALGRPAGELHGRSPLALRLARELLAPPRRAVMPRERAAFGLVMAGPDRDEGIRAFRERRPPRFGW